MRQKLTNSFSMKRSARSVGAVTILLVASILSACGGDRGTRPEEEPQPPKPPRPLAAIYYAADNNGDTLYQMVKAQYAKYYIQKDSVCRVTYNWQYNEWIQVEISGCVVTLATSTSYTEADKLNGIDLKGTGFIGGTAFRLNTTGAWEEWRTFYGGSFAPAIQFRRKFGVFELTPDPGFKLLRLLNE